MKKITSIRNVILLLFLSATICGCLSFDLSYLKEPVFAIPAETLLQNVKQVNDFEFVDIKWNASWSGPDTTHSLSLVLVNGRGLPDNDDDLRKKGQELMQIVIDRLENDKDYQMFSVTFSKRKKNWIISFNNSRSFQYRIGEFIPAVI